MWSCVAVTRGGWGDAWGFASPAEARAHPLVQEYDAVVASPEDVSECWNYLHIARFLEDVLSRPAAARSARDDLEKARDIRDRERILRAHSELAWDRLRQEAKAPPLQPARVVDLIKQDRERYDAWYHREQNRRNSAMTAASTETAKTPKAPKEPKPAAEKKIAGFATTAKIALGSNEKGKFGKDNNPKRAGSKSHASFALYKDGMTLADALKAGITAADIKWDIDHKFISVSA